MSTGVVTRDGDIHFRANPLLVLPALMVADQIVMTSYKGRTKAKTIGHHVEMIRGGGWLRLAFHPDKNL